jgi:hypothetical protein
VGSVPPPTSAVPSGSPVPLPPDAPDASNTGPHGRLAASGSLVITKPGTYDHLDVHGHIDVRVAGVTLSDVRVDAADANYAIRNFSDGHLTITDCDLGPVTPDHQTDAAVVYADYTLERCNIHGTGDGLKANGNTQILDSYIHDMYESAGNHSDGIQISAGSHVLIEHDTIVSRPLDDAGLVAVAVSCVMVKADQGPIDDVQIRSSRLAGDPGFLVYSRKGADYPTPSHVVIQGNAMVPQESSPGAHDGYIWGQLNADVPGPAFTGNATSTALRAS